LLSDSDRERVQVNWKGTVEERERTVEGRPETGKAAGPFLRKFERGGGTESSVQRRTVTLKMKKQRTCAYKKEGETVTLGDEDFRQDIHITET